MPGPGGVPAPVGSGLGVPGPGGAWSWGVPAPGGVPGPGGFWSRGCLVETPRMGTAAAGTHPTLMHSCFAAEICSQ